MKCAWRWCDRVLDEPIENVFCTQRHAHKWVKLHNKDRRAAMHMIKQIGYP